MAWNNRVFPIAYPQTDSCFSHPVINPTDPHCWYVNIVSDNSKVKSGGKPLHESMLTKFHDTVLTGTSS